MPFLLALLAVLVAAPAFAASLVEEDLMLPVAIGRTPIELEALVVRPGGGGRHPLAVISHGSPRDAAERSGMRARNQIAKAREFARRGWVALVVMRRGYGTSQGGYVESTGPCGSPDYEASGKRSAEDIRASIAAMAERPYVDASRVLAVGQSAGGFASVALAAEPPPGLVAGISFAGGRGSQKPDEVCSPEKLLSAFAAFGRTARVPMLWVYAENDHYFSPRLAREFHAAFTRAGGRAELVVAPEFGADGHLLFSAGGIARWTGLVDTFLAGRGLGEAPPPRAAVPYPKALSANGRAAFDKYLDAPAEKAFAMAPTGAFGWRSGRPHADEAAAEALRNCAAYAPQSCRVIMINDEPR